jgi:acetyl esterase/lipase
MQTGESELLARDSVEYARRLEIYRGTVQLEMYPDMPHVFPMFAPLGLEDGHIAVRRQSKFVMEVLQGSVKGTRHIKILPSWLQKRNFSQDNFGEHIGAVKRRMSQTISSPVLQQAKK